jgi:membrane protein YdbS with pleckstrin-like domain
VRFPDLIPGESKALHLHPHWKALVRPAIWSVLFLSLGAIAAVLALPAVGPVTLPTIGPVTLPTIGPVTLPTIGPVTLPLPAVGQITAGAVGVGALVLFLWLGFPPYIRWRSTHYVFTNRQVLYKVGVFKRIELGIPLSKVNDVRIDQTLFERILGCGTLTIESAGEQSRQALPDLPRIRKAARVLKQLVGEVRSPTPST